MSLSEIELDLTKYPIPRVRHHVSPQVYLPASQHKTLPAWYPPAVESVDFTSLFGNQRPPDVLDIGCGRGGFLLQHALKHPHLNILGLEVRNMLVEWVNGVIAGENLPNVASMWYSVANGLDFIAPQSIEFVTYLFADPWPKKRHHKRRAFTVELCSDIVRTLRPGGKLYLATDRADVEEHQLAILHEHGGFHVQSCSPEQWPFDFTTDQQRFCDKKSIPYTMTTARLR